MTHTLFISKFIITLMMSDTTISEGILAIHVNIYEVDRSGRRPQFVHHALRSVANYSLCFLPSDIVLMKN